MLGLQAKTAAISVVERIWSASGQDINNLSVIFAGKTANVSVKPQSGRKGLIARINLPAIDESAVIEVSLFNNIIGYVLHELGHGLYTTRVSENNFLGKLIDALEDSRVEAKIMDSEIAGNAKALFEGLINSILKKGTPDSTLKESVPDLLAIEGRRLNGLSLIVPSTIESSPFEEPIIEALNELQFAANTADVVEIATVLMKALDIPESESGGGGEGEGEKEKGEGEGEGKGEGEGEEDSEGEGKEPDKSEPDKSEGKPPKKSGGGGGGTSKKKTTEIDFAKEIEKSIKKTTGDLHSRLPARTKPKIFKFNWS